MARVPLNFRIKLDTGLPVSGATVNVYLRGTVTPVTVYTAETGAPTLTQPLTSDAAGVIPGWVDEDKRLDIRVAKSGVVTYTQQFEAIRGSTVGVRASLLGIVPGQLEGKGDILVAEGPDSVVNKKVGPDDQYLRAQPKSVDGLAWATITQEEVTGLEDTLLALSDRVFRANENYTTKVLNDPTIPAGIIFEWPAGIVVTETEETSIKETTDHLPNGVIDSGQAGAKVWTTPAGVKTTGTASVTLGYTKTTNTTYKLRHDKVAEGYGGAPQEGYISPTSSWTENYVTGTDFNEGLWGFSRGEGYPRDWIWPERAVHQDGNPNHYGGDFHGPEGATDYQIVTGFMHQVPANGWPLGVEVLISRWSKVELPIYMQGGQGMYDHEVRLVLNDQPLGDDHSTGMYWEQGGSVVIFGSNSDKWGLGDSLDPAAANSNAFGASIRGWKAGGVETSGHVDTIRIKLTYTVPILHEDRKPGVWEYVAGASTLQAIDDKPMINRDIPVGTDTYETYPNVAFAIPTDAAIDGVVAQVHRRGRAGSVVDNIIRLWNGNDHAVIGGNKATGTFHWPDSMALATYGSPTDDWGAAQLGTPLTPAKLNGAFGLTLRARNVGSVPATVYVDRVKLLAYYHYFTIETSTTTEDVQEISHYLQAEDFRFAIPADAVIKGIEVKITAKASTNTITDYSVKIVKNDALAGSQRRKLEPWPDTFTQRTYGANNDLWGETWTPANINSPDFGVAIALQGGIGVAEIDTITMHIHYQATTKTTTTTKGPLLPEGGYLECNGQAVSRTQYNALFDAIGITYGKGNGLDTFNVPDIRGRVTVAPVPDNMGNTGGAESVKLLAAQTGVSAHDHTASSPSHTHVINTTGTHTHNAQISAANRGVSNTMAAGTAVEGLINGTGLIFAANGDHTHTLSSQAFTVTINSSSNHGAIEPHTNLMPYIIYTKVIKT